ncbi:selenide, water dikinase SelD [Alcanivorax sp. JB21]|uniref:selenide, water dikinase SelD n=1 Tax=Alcanivorax limicola TaxID=2874102 RepID=UPI001CBEE18F|nr:selenide, water dikinase SelD [Alcanivorax limicola]MBZ2187697.1 selenide, water dikinase SelD [Alcanivorax limicola]
MNHHDGASQDLLLIGGGHSHALVLRRLGMRPLANTRITLVSPDSLTPYSGMLPGLVAGHYTEEETHIDLRRLCQWADVRFVRDRVVALDADHRQLTLAHGAPLHYDMLSLDIGSTPDLDSVPGARTHAVPVKPVSSFRQRWDALLTRLRQQPQQQARICVVGAGAGGTEMILAIARALSREQIRASLTLVSGGQLLPGYPSRARQAMARELAHAGVRVLSHFNVARVDAHQLTDDNGGSEAFDFLLWCTGACGAPWLAASGLAVTEQGFVRVGRNLQSLHHKAVFAAGDCAWLEGLQLPRAGVYAVRQAPVLAHNLATFAERGPEHFQKACRNYTPQRRFLSLLSAGLSTGLSTERPFAVASRGGLSASGAWVWHWKNRIDRNFMRLFSDLPARQTMATRETDGTAAMHCQGCGAKLGPDALRHALEGLEGYPRDEVLTDFRSGDDAALVRWPARQLLVQSQDYFPAFIDEPWLFGRIATLHSLSDLHAMNATPHSALATVSIAHNHPRLQQRDLRQLMQGALSALQESHCSLLGGHTIEGPQMAAGFAVNGSADPAKLLHKKGARPGDVLLLTKPLGTGILLAAQMRQRCKGPWLDAALESMLANHGPAAGVFAQHGATACTDVTGFGLLGHLLEMLDKSQVGANLTLSALPVLPGAITLAGQGIGSSLKPANDVVLSRCHLAPGVAGHPLLTALTDPQTSGGLLASVPAAQHLACIAALHALGLPCWHIGHCTEDGGQTRLLR